jgi:hypothetical protein
LEISAKRRSLVRPSGAWSAAAARAGVVTRQAIAAKHSHSNTFHRTGMGLIAIAPEEGFPGQLASYMDGWPGISFRLG